MVNKSIKNIYVLGVLVIAIMTGIFLLTSAREIQEVEITEDVQASKNDNLGESIGDINFEISSILEVLMSIHYIYTTENNDTNPDTFIFSELQEALNDKVKLDRLHSKVDLIVESNNEVVSASGLVLRTTLLSLITTHESWIQYLRTVSIDTVDVTEFQYQFAKLQSDSKGAYLNLADGMSLLPVVAVEYDENGGFDSFNNEIRIPMLSRIDELFEGIFVENDLYEQETGNNYVVPLIITSYIDFLEIEY